MHRLTEFKPDLRLPSRNVTTHANNLRSQNQGIFIKPLYINGNYIARDQLSQVITLDAKITQLENLIAQILSETQISGHVYNKYQINRAIEHFTLELDTLTRINSEGITAEEAYDPSFIINLVNLLSESWTKRDVAYGEYADNNFLMQATEYELNFTFMEKVSLASYRDIPKLKLNEFINVRATRFAQGTTIKDVGIRQGDIADAFRINPSMNSLNSTDTPVSPAIFVSDLTIPTIILKNKDVPGESFVFCELAITKQKSDTENLAFQVSGENYVTGHIGQMRLIPIQLKFDETNRSSLVEPLFLVHINESQPYNFSAYNEEGNYDSHLTLYSQLNPDYTLRCNVPTEFAKTCRILVGVKVGPTATPLIPFIDASFVGVNIDFYMEETVNIEPHFFSLRAYTKTVSAESFSYEI